MKLIFFFLWASFLFQHSGVFAADEELSCFYLDREKVENDILAVELVPVDAASDAKSIRLNGGGLYHGNERVCQWSLNGGSGTKEQFSLDGDFAIPILDPECETPFGHELTGVGFGDWYLTLCGVLSNSNLQVSQESKFVTKMGTLQQWTEFVPGEFPIRGDAGD